MQSLYYPLVGIVLYFAADAILRRVEAYRGAPFVHRTVVFFCILLLLALATFAAIRRVVGQ